MNEQLDDKFLLARNMRGKVPEFDNTYIERYIPQDILSNIIELDGKMDKYGFWCGPSYVWATKTKDNEIVIIIATKPLGQGFYELKALKIDGNHNPIITLTSADLKE
jgi:hypothetical protein